MSSRLPSTNQDAGLTAAISRPWWKRKWGIAGIVVAALLIVGGITCCQSVRAGIIIVAAGVDGSRFGQRGTDLRRIDPNCNAGTDDISGGERPSDDGRNAGTNASANSAADSRTYSDADRRA